MPRIVLAGGGTGGHITPMLHCAQALRRLDSTVELHLVSERGELSDRWLKDSDWQLHAIKAGKWRRYMGQSWIERLLDFKTAGQNVLDLGKFSIGLVQSLGLLWRLKPQAVFVKGGYVGLPVGIAAWTLGIPLIIHESDVKPGITNRILAPLSSVIATGWPSENYPQWQHKKLVYSGNIVGLDDSRQTASQAAEFFDLGSRLPTLLVVGGSSGAQAINQAIKENLAELIAHFQVIHVAGLGNHEQFRQQLPKLPELEQRYRLYGVLPTAKLQLGYLLSDLIISRAGANSLAEIAVLGRPLIVVPYRYATSSHQLANARMLEKFDAALVVEEAELSKKLMQNVRSLIEHPKYAQVLAKNIKQLAIPNAATKLAQEILGLK